MLSFGETCIHTVGFNCRIDNHGVAECINYRLSYKNLGASFTMLTLGKTCCSTSGSYCRISYLVVLAGLIE